MAAQHQQYGRKVELRRQLLESAGTLEGAIYVPFCGDADLAIDCYVPHPKLRPFYCADLDPARAATATARLAEIDATVIAADCDSWPWHGHEVPPLAVVDLDAYAYPYDAWRAVKTHASLAPRCLVLFTDGQRQAINRTATWREPDGTKARAKLKSPEARSTYNFWWVQHVQPWWADELDDIGYRSVADRFYVRDASMLYWGALIEQVTEKSGAKETPPDADMMVAKADQLDARRGPYKFDTLKREEYLELLRAGNRRHASAVKVGVDPRTVRRWMNADPTFRDEVSLAETQAHEGIENALYLAAQSGNVTAMIFYLTNMMPETWKDRRGPQKVVISGDAAGAPIRVDLGIEELRAQAFAVLEEARAKEAQARAMAMPVLELPAAQNGDDGDDDNGAGEPAA